MENPIPVGKAFQEWLVERDLNQAQFVAESGLSAATVCRLCNALDGEVGKMRWGTVVVIRDAMDRVELNG